MSTISRAHTGILAALLAAALSSGCGVSFESGSNITTLRVLAVQKDRPYARPGEDVALQLMWHDPARDADPSLPPPSIGWIAACNNPDGDLYELCFEQFAAAFIGGEDLTDRVIIPEPGASEANDRFSVTVPADVISSRPPPTSDDQVPYGLSYVFFAVCSGALAIDPSGGFPLLCYTEQDGSDGFTSGDTRLGSEDFVVGYSSIFSYESVENQNPIVTGIDFNGVTFVSEASSSVPDGAVALPERDLCIGEACATPTPDDLSASCSEPLTVPICDGCEVPLKPAIDPASAEPDEVATRLSGSELGEQMWLNYYSSRGEVDDEVRLLNDATTGWSDNFDSDFASGDQPGVGYVWAIAHDNRGGAEWLRLRICIE
ncbi:MAG: hypothetical protein ABW217_02575 [Polyangiaceae bacterium]